MDQTNETNDAAKSKGDSRRKFLKRGAVGAAAASAVTVYAGRDVARETLRGRSTPEGAPRTDGGRATALAGADPIPIDGPTTITEPGVYRLAADIDAAGIDTCIEIAADDVALHGDGHAIEGSGGRGVSLGVPLGDGPANVEIENLSLTGFDVGIYCGSTVGTAIRDVEISACDTGLRCEATRDLLVADSEFADGGTGVQHHEVCRRSTLVGNVAADNERAGFSLGEDAAELRLLDNVARYNGGSGIELFGRTEGCALRGNVAVGNGGYGIAVALSSDDAGVVGNAASDNGEAGFVVEGAGNRLVQNESRGNDGHGIEVAADCDGTVLRRNSVCDNGGEQLFVHEDATNTQRAGNTEC